MAEELKKVCTLKDLLNLLDLPFSKDKLLKTYKPYKALSTSGFYLYEDLLLIWNCDDKVKSKQMSRQESLAVFEKERKQSEPGNLDEFLFLDRNLEWRHGIGSSFVIFLIRKTSAFRPGI